MGKVYSILVFYVSFGLGLLPLLFMAVDKEFTIKNYFTNVFMANVMIFVAALFFGSIFLSVWLFNYQG